MLRSAEVRATLVLPDSPFHNLHWVPNLEFSLDCFICERTERTVKFEHGAERAVCTGDSDTGPHYAAARIASFDHTSQKEWTALLAVLDYWWAPFQDAKRDRRAGSALARTPWVRLNLGYYCPEQGQSGQFSTQTNLVRPATSSCKHCSAEVARSDETPRIRLLT